MRHIKHKPLSIMKPKLRQLKATLLTPEQKILLALWRDPLSPPTLLLVTELPSSALYHSLRRLEARKLVKQINGLYYLTDTGKKLVDELINNIMTWIK